MNCYCDLLMNCSWSTPAAHGGGRSQRARRRATGRGGAGACGEGSAAGGSLAPRLPDVWSGTTASRTALLFGDAASPPMYNAIMNSTRYVPYKVLLKVVVFRV